MRARFIGSLIFAVCLAALPVSAAQYPAGQTAPQDEGQPPQVMPPQSPQYGSSLTLPAGTIVTVRLTDLLSSDRNRVGDAFTTVLDQPLVAQGLVVAERGQTAMGRVAAAQSAGRVQGVSQLAVELNELVLVDGQQVPVRTQLIQSSAGTSRGRDVAGVGATTGVGAAIGAAAGGGTGAAIGAAAGAVAGIAGVLSTRGRATELYPETLLTFRLSDPVTISTDQSRQAFRPVTKEDYQGAVQRNPARYPMVDSAPPPPPYYYPGYYYYPGWYPPPGYWGYGYYGYGPTFIFGSRGFYGRGFRHR